MQSQKQSCAGGGASTGRENVLGHACDSNDGGAGATWSQIDASMTDYASGVAYCQSQGASLCPRSRYCMQGVGGAPVGGRRGGDQWAPTSDSDNSWVQVRPNRSGVAPHRPLLTVVLRLGQVGTWGGSEENTCVFHHELNGGQYGKPAWGTTPDEHGPYQGWVLCCA